MTLLSKAEFEFDITFFEKRIVLFFSSLGNAGNTALFCYILLRNIPGHFILTAARQHSHHFRNVKTHSTKCFAICAFLSLKT